MYKIIIQIGGWLLIGALLYLLLKVLNKWGLVSNRALEGKETKKVRIAKIILLVTILIFILGYALFYFIAS